MKSRINKILLLFCFMLISLLAYSQKGPPPPVPPPNPGLPIDGGISYLLVAGAIYGAYSLKKKNK